MLSGGARPVRPASRGRRRVEERLDTLRGTCFCLLYDLNAWLARAEQPVPLELREYRLAGLRHLTDPRERLSRYVKPELLQAWQQALKPFFEAGTALAPDLGETANLLVEGLDGEGGALAELRFTSRSRVVDRRHRLRPLPGHDWLLRVSLASDLDRVEDARLLPL